jgi:hypothetical protein
MRGTGISHSLERFRRQSSVLAASELALFGLHPSVAAARILMAYDEHLANPNSTCVQRPAGRD